MVKDANFAQSKTRRDEVYSLQGREHYSKLAGVPINNIDDMVAAIRSGRVHPSQLPVDFVEKNGVKLILNSRTSVTLNRAGIPKSEWYGVDKTDVKVPDGAGITFNDLASDQLKTNKLPPTGSPDIPQGGKK